ncbi:hypothetical protein SUGI_0068440 [Cryptomeria japonica]|nr:hypothetical protein SUGI_0068440 [Cryptomeria japonica]
MRILLTIRKLDQTDMFSRSDFEGIPYEEFLKESVAAGVAIERVVEQAYKSLDVALVKLSFDNDAENFCSILWGTEEDLPQFILENRNVKVHDIIKERRLSQPDRILELVILKDALQDRQKLQKIKGFQLQ